MCDLLATPLQLRLLVPTMVRNCTVPPVAGTNLLLLFLAGTRVPRSPYLIAAPQMFDQLW